MDIRQARIEAKERYQGFCKVCNTCDGRSCAGQVPGMGGIGSGSAFNINVQKLAQIRLNMRTIHQAQNPQLSTQLLGRQLSTPIIAAPITGISYNCGGAITEEAFAKFWVQGCAQAGTLGMTGDGADPSMYAAGLAGIKEYGGIPFIKPRSQTEILTRIKQAEEAGAAAVGIDIDGAGLVTMALKGQPVGPKTKEELQELVQSTSLPFILKGIMTVDEAQLAVEIGAQAIVVSNHGGRVLDYTPATCEVLPAICDAVQRKLQILVDGGIRSGTDVLKMLALGADAVLVGRPFITATIGNEAQGLASAIDQMSKELLQAMILTGTSSVQEVQRHILYNY